MENIWRYCISVPTILISGLVYATSEKDAFFKLWKKYAKHPISVNDVKIWSAILDDGYEDGILEIYN